MATKHIIKKQIIELEIPEDLDRAAIQNRVSRIYRQEIIPILDKVLSKKSTSSKLIIDHLDIHLGRISISRLESVLAAKIGQALQERLNKIETPAIQESSATLQQSIAVQESHTDAELLMYFLQTGLFPWWVQETTYTSLEKVFHSLLAQSSPVFKNNFKQLLQENAIIKRLVYTFNDALLMQVAEQFVSGNINTVWQQKEQLLNVFTNLLSAQQLREYWWWSVYQTISTSGIRSDEELFEKAGSAFVFLAAQKGDWKELLHYMQNESSTPGILEKINSFAKLEAQNKNVEPSSIKRAEGHPSSLNRESKKGAHSRENTDSSFLNNSKLFTKPFTDLDKIYIQNAGLVLLWPFLQRFFQNMDLADDKTFTTDANAERACLLLQYLVSGSSEEMFEAQLPLNKILSGIPLLHPISTQWIISDQEKEIVENFLLAVIQNGGVGWKNLSVNGLRQAYLNREGIISGRDGNWLLQVKRETYDILVERLPWTVQVVKLPWMERLLFVEW